jgi:cytochrome b pre-mRNA-processing protein 6
MQRRIDKTEKATTSAPITSPADANASPSAAARPFNETKEMQQVSVLSSLLDNRISKAYPMPQSLRYPANRPTHYDDVVREMEEAPSRSWFGSLTKKIKGSLRFS